VIDDPGDTIAIQPVDAIDLLDQPSVDLGQSRVDPVTLLEPVEVGHRDISIEVVGAGPEQVCAGPGRLAGYHRVDVGIEERPAQPIEQRVERFARPTGKLRPATGGGAGEPPEALRRASQGELAGR
jgi:hypothetical protein